MGQGDLGLGFYSADCKMRRIGQRLKFPALRFDVELQISKIFITQGGVFDPKS